MKNRIVGSLLGIIFFSTSSFGQVWSGSTVEGNSYRNGNVSIGTSNATQKLNVNGQGVFLESNASADPGDGLGPALRLGFSVWGGGYGYLMANHTAMGTRNLIFQQNGGNVGIGTINPIGLLDINGGWNNLAKVSIRPAQILLYCPTGTSTNTYPWSMGVQGGTGNLEFSSGASTPAGSESITSKVVFLPSGNVGIGASSPKEKLEVAGNLKLNSTGSKIYWDWSERTIEQYSPDNISSTIRFRNSMSAGTNNPQGGFDFADYNGASVLRIVNNRVGIGTINPGALLTVNGLICAKEVKVSLSGAPCWADYVFENTYKLRSLFEVEAFIKQNKHLPEIPSATEVERNGINLGEMDALLLKKIEELTLYMIEMKKENDSLKEKINVLEGKIK